MFIRPWVQIILARLKNPEGWHFSDYTLDLDDGEGYVLLELWNSNHWLHTCVWSWKGKNKPKGLELTWVEQFVLCRAMRQLARLTRTPKINNDVDMQADVITNLTGLEQ